MRGIPTLLILILTVPALPHAAEGSQVELASYEGRVEILPQHLSRVTIHLTLDGLGSGAEDDPIGHDLLIYDGQQLSNFTFIHNGRPLTFKKTFRRRIIRFDVDLPASDYAGKPRFDYTAQFHISASNKEDLIRIPLLVPHLKTPLGEPVVSLAVEVRNGESPTADQFPNWNWLDSRQASTDLKNVPSFIKIVTSAGERSGLSESLSNPNLWSDAFLFLSVLLGSMIWWKRFRQS